MAWAVTPAIRTALDSGAAETAHQFLLWLDGDTGPGYDFSYMLSSWKINRTASDSSGALVGSVGATASIRLSWLGDSTVGADGFWKTLDLAPYTGALTAFRDRGYGIGMKVQLRFGVKDAAGVVGLSPAFLGRISSVEVLSDTSVQLGLQDFSIDLQNQAQVPVAAVGTSQFALPVYTVVEHLLRSGGFYRTPPPLDGTVLSVPAILPEVGSVAGPLTTEPNGYALNSYLAAPSYDNSYTATDSFHPTVGDTVTYEGWLKSATVAGKRVLVRWGDETPGPWGLQLWIHPNNRIVASTLDESILLATTNPTVVWPNDDAWHYLQIELRYTTTVATLWHQIDGVAGGDAGSLALPRVDNLSPRVVLGGLAHEGVSLRVSRAARTVRNTWTPNYNVDIRGTPFRLRSIPRGVEGTAWEMIQAIAQDTGSVCRWREDGAWRWQNRDSLMQRRTEAPVVTMAADRVSDGSYSYNAESMRKSVTADWTTYGVQRSTAANPAWSATETIIVPPGTTTLAFETPAPIFGLARVIRSSTPDANASTVQVVPASQVGLPDAPLVAGLRFTLAPTDTGFTMTVVNPWTYDCALWDPATLKPFALIQGWSVVGGQPQTYTMGASRWSREALIVPPSLWRQDRLATIGLVEGLAVEVAQPLMRFPALPTVYDPTLTVDDITTLGPLGVLLPTAMPVQLTGIDSGSDSVSQLQVRATLPPTGWVLGVVGRSELGTTARLTA